MSATASKPLSEPDARGLCAPATRPQIPDGLPQTVAAVLDAHVARSPGALALIGRHGRFTFAELDLEVNRAAAVLTHHGVGPGERVAACLPNDVDIVIAFLATQRLGALWVGINRPLAPPEKVYILNDSGARVLLAMPEAVEQLAPLRQSLPQLEALLRVDPDSDRCEWRARLRAITAPPRPAVAIDPFAPAAIAYTSGTTGHPKGAVHSQHNLLIPGAVSHLTHKFPPGIRQASVLPLTILNLFVLEVLVAYVDGRCCVCIDRIDPPGLAEWVEREQVGSFTGVPTIFHDLLTHPDVRPEQLASLVEPGMGGSDVPPETVALYRARFGKGVAIGYGMTEAPTAVTWSDGQVPTMPGLCGRPLPQCCIEILDPEGRVLPQGEIGEICVSPAREGPFAGLYTPMLGYWGKPDATRAALAGGRYHTGDLGFLDVDGNLYIRGRRNELILRGGANVYPAEVERVLQAHPAVAAAAVFGRPDPRLGERVVAAVELRPGASASEEGLRAYALEQLARYKVPEKIRFTPQMPRNAMNKIVKRELHPLFDT